MPGCTLAAPFDDETLAGRVDIRVDPGTGTPVVVSVVLPSAAGVPAYYSRGVTIPAPTVDDLGARVAAALTSAGAGSWSWGYIQDANTGGWKGSLATSYTPAGAVTIEWSHADTTFDPSWLGYGTADISEPGGSPVVFPTPYHVGRLWRYPFPVFPQFEEVRQTIQSRTWRQTVNNRSYGSGKVWVATFPVIQGPAFLQSDIQDPDIVVMVPGLTTDEPNFAFSETHKYLNKQAPARFLRDELVVLSYLSWQVLNDDPKNRISDWLDAPKNTADKANESPPYWDMKLAAVDYGNQ